MRRRAVGRTDGLVWRGGGGRPKSLKRDIRCRGDADGFGGSGRSGRRDCSWGRAGPRRKWDGRKRDCGRRLSFQPEERAASVGPSFRASGPLWSSSGSDILVLARRFPETSARAESPYVPHAPPVSLLAVHRHSSVTQWSTPCRPDRLFEPISDLGRQGSGPLEKASWRPVRLPRGL